MIETAAPQILTLYGHWRSSCTQRVQIGLRLKGVPYRYVPIDLARREQEGEAFRALHPGAQVPVLVAGQGEAVLSQSLAILEWLEETFPNQGVPLLPADPLARFRAREIAQFVATTLQPFQLPGAIRRRWIACFTAGWPPQADQEKDGREDGQAAEGLCSAFSRAHLEALLPELQRLVGRSEGPFCLGTEPSLADCCVVPQLEGAARLGVDVNRWPALSRLAEHARQVAAFRESEPLRQCDAPALQGPTPAAGVAPAGGGGGLLGPLQALAGKEPADGLRRYLLEEANAPIPQLEWVRQQTALRFPALTTKVSAVEICLLLRWLTELWQPSLAVEVGVFTGSSSLAIATALPAGGRLIGFDIAEDSTALARQAWQRAGVAERVSLRLEDGALGLPRLQGEDLAGKVDLAYVDGANNQYQKNLEDVLPLLRPGGLLVFDNTLWKGEVADSSSTDSQAAHLRELNRQLRQDPNLLSCVLSLGDGVSLAIKRSAT